MIIYQLAKHYWQRWWNELLPPEGNDYIDEDEDEEDR